MSNSTLHITVTNSAYFEALKQDSVDGYTNWTVHKNVRPGDKVCLYVCAPISSIVATAIVAGSPAKETEPSNPWYGHYMVDLVSLTMLPTHPTRTSLIESFPDWRYWTQPRNSIIVPHEYRDALMKLLKVSGEGEI